MSPNPIATTAPLAFDDVDRVQRTDCASRPACVDAMADAGTRDDAEETTP